MNLKFMITRKVKYGEIEDAQGDNDVALKLMHEFAVNEKGEPFTDDEWKAIYRDFDYPDELRTHFIEFQTALINPTKGAH